MVIMIYDISYTSSEKRINDEKGRQSEIKSSLHHHLWFLFSRSRVEASHKIK